MFVLGKKGKLFSVTLLSTLIIVGCGGGDGGSSTSNFMSNLIKSLPPLHEVAGMAGVELPDYLGNIKGGATKAAAPAPKAK